MADTEEMMVVVAEAQSLLFDDSGDSDCEIAAAILADTPILT